MGQAQGVLCRIKLGNFIEIESSRVWYPRSRKIFSEGRAIGVRHMPGNVKRDCGSLLLSKCTVS